jgi:DNA-binding SARP family transcriptional activator
VAKAAEPLDWAVSAHHYIEAEHRADAMRVLRESAIEAVGTARWGAATALVDRMPDQPIPEAVMVIRALHLASQGHARRAVVMLENLSPSPDDPMAWGLTKLALANVHLVLGHLDVVRSVIAETANFEGLPGVVDSLVTGFTVLIAAHDGGHFADVSRVMDDLAVEHVRLGLSHFAGVSYHNGAFAAYARGQYDRCIELGIKAMQQFELTPARYGIESTQTLVAQALLERGESARASAYLEPIGTCSKIPADAQADRAWVAAAMGDTATAWIYIEQAARTALDASTVPSASAYARYAKALAHIVDGNLGAAAEAVQDADLDSVEPDAVARHAAMGALVALLSEDRPAARRLARDGLASAEAQGVQHWVRWLSLLLAVADSDADGYRRSLVMLLANAKLSMLILADAVTLGLGLLDEAPDDVVELVKLFPSRWIPVLRRVVSSGDRNAGMVAANLLSRFGSIEDVPLLSAFERRHIRQAGRRTFSKALARHVNPTMVVHDLGRLRIQLGHRTVALSQSRRKAAALLAYLASRPEHAATRDQVLDAMWPHQSPEGAANSLHQTLFFLRRDIDPWFEEGHSVDYVVVEPDVVYLDPQLVQVDSAAFFRQVSVALSSKDTIDLVLPIVRDYQAKFALDFEYEDWSVAWRDQLHGLFLDAVEQAADGLLARGRYQVATEILERALAVDADALGIERRLVVALHRSGATAAASHQHRHFAQAHEAEHGEAPPSLRTLLDRDDEGQGHAAESV